MSLHDSSFDAKITENAWVVYVCNLCLLPVTVDENGRAIVRFAQAIDERWVMENTKDGEDFVIASERRTADHKYVRVHQTDFPAIKTQDPLMAYKSTFSKVIRFAVHNRLYAHFPDQPHLNPVTRKMSAICAHIDDVVRMLSVLLKTTLIRVARPSDAQCMYVVGHHVLTFGQHKMRVSCCGLPLSLVYPCSITFNKSTSLFSAHTDEVVLCIWRAIVTSAPDPRHTSGRILMPGRERVCAWFRYVAGIHDQYQHQAGTGKYAHAVDESADTLGQTDASSPELSLQ